MRHTQTHARIPPPFYILKPAGLIVQHNSMYYYTFREKERQLMQQRDDIELQLRRLMAKEGGLLVLFFCVSC